MMSATDFSGIWSSHSSRRAYPTLFMDIPMDSKCIPAGGSDGGDLWSAVCGGDQGGFGHGQMDDLVERLSETILRLKGKRTVHTHPCIMDEITVASLEEKLLETLEDLSDGELENFKRGLQRISSQRLETAGRVEIVDLMVEIYGQQSMELTMEILKKMKEDDHGLEQILSNITLGSKGVKSVKCISIVLFQASKKTSLTRISCITNLL
ncbi:hypothetical protein F7725_018211 [Dissostichus mawsoni]|uniref:Pyrin domain-containing protein n=1 Tax=Dissostichus mawsoni TaxID=36200 RepID=A0A7J5XQW3_DISMA|nr:hypothetical protein F7725_018211 [Dissostichus mawsoni]